MKKFILFVAPLLIGSLLYAYTEEPIPENNSDVTWHTITVVDYKPGTENTARELIKKFESASLAAGTLSPVIYWFETGKYDLVVTWELQEKPADKKWSWSPEGKLWWSALVAQEGSEEAAKQVQNNYNELIASAVTNVARKAK